MRFLAYIATSVDGFVATPDGSVGWLDAFAGEDHGYAEFMAHVHTIVIGRRTYDQVLGFGEWPYPGKRVIVLTGSALGSDPPPDTSAWSEGVDSLAASLRAEDAGDVWVLGGAETLRGFREAGAVDEWEIFLIPLLLGGGIPLFPGIASPRELSLVETRSWPNGVVKLQYRVV